MDNISNINNNTSSKSEDVASINHTSLTEDIPKCFNINGCFGGQNNVKTLEDYNGDINETMPVVCSDCGQFSCVKCKRSFSSKRGLSLHFRSAHSKQYHSANIPAPKTRVRWTVELLREVARAEINLSSKTRFINEAIVSILPMYSIHSIRNVRYNNGRYKEVLSEIRSEIIEATLREIPVTSSYDNELNLGVQSEDEIRGFIDLDLLQCPDSVDLGSQEIIDWLHQQHFPEKPRKEKICLRIKKNPGSNSVLSTRKRRKQLYRKLQQGFQKNRSKTIKTIIDGSYRFPNSQQPAGLEDFWRSTFTQSSQKDERHIKKKTDGDLPLMEPILIEEINHVLSLRKSGSPGVDGYKWTDIKRINIKLLQSCLNLWLYSGRIPSILKVGVTSLIPKVPGTAKPEEFRPITVSSVFLRLYHCILSNRMEKILPISPRQKGFRKGDGIYFNSKLLQKMIYSAKHSGRDLCMAFIDIKKAFDSVSHYSLWVACRWIGIPECFINYLRDYYDSSTTMLKLDKGFSDVIKVTRGIKQGDPLSVHLFNIVMEMITVNLSTKVGFMLGETQINYIAYADDLIIFADGHPGIKEHFYNLQREMTMCGLQINTNKCATLYIQHNKKMGKWVVNDRAFLKCENKSIRALEPNETYKYLGAEIGSKGSKCNPETFLREALEFITEAPLKPQQRLYIVRNHLVPKMLHPLVFSTIRKGHLKTLDNLIRSFTKRWLKMKIACSNAAIYADIKDGGLGISKLEFVIPLLRFKRDLKLLNYDDTLSSSLIDHTCIRAPIFNGVAVSNKNELRSLNANKLFSEVDGGGLSQHNGVPQAHNWLRYPTKLLSGRSFIRMIQLRYCLMVTRLLKHRYNNELPSTCPYCPTEQHSLSHILQKCPSAKGTRIERHNALAKYIMERAKGKGYTVVWEPYLKSSDGLLKPDLIYYKDGDMFVLDVTVISDGRDLETAHNEKVCKYKRASVDVELRKIYSFKKVYYGAFAINWRGAVSISSRNFTKNILTLGDMQILSVRTLEYGVYIYDGSRGSASNRPMEIPITKSLRCQLEDGGNSDADVLSAPLMIRGVDEEVNENNIVSPVPRSRSRKKFGKYEKKKKRQFVKRKNISKPHYQQLQLQTTQKIFNNEKFTVNQEEVLENRDNHPVLPPSGKQNIFINYSDINFTSSDESPKSPPKETLVLNSDNTTTININKQFLMRNVEKNHRKPNQKNKKVSKDSFKIS